MPASRPCPAALSLALVAALGALAPVARAGDVSVKLKGTTLVIKGSDGADDLIVGSPFSDAGDGDAPGETLLLTPGKGTTLNGSSDPLTLDGVVNVTLAMGDGPDTVLVDHVFIDGSMKANGNEGNDTFTFDNASLDQDVKVVSSTGTLGLSLLDSSVGRDLVIKGGNDPDTITLTGSFVGRNVKGVLLSGADSVTFDQSPVGEDLTIRSGLDDNAFQLLHSNVGSLFTYAGGSGADDVLLQDSSIGETANLKLGPGSNHLVVDATSFNMSIGESLVVKGGPQDDEVVLTDANGAAFPNVLVGEGTKLSLSKGANMLQTAGRLQSFGLTYIGAGDDDSVDSTGLDSGADVRFSLAAGTNSVTLTDATLDEDLFITAGNGDDTVTLAGTTSVAGKQKINLAGGSNSLTVP